VSLKPAAAQKFRYQRKVEVRPIGYFEGNVFKEGIKYLPMIKDAALLMPEERVSSIYGKTWEKNYVIGRMLKEDIPVSLPWRVLFNSHIGIFGNTGSGKSNTLAKLYTVLFDNKKESMQGKSQFVVLDFNGEYTGEQLLPAPSKALIKLSTAGQGGDKFCLAESEFWSLEVLSLLFHQIEPST
jgi:DNA helicase HerA-like ATPase